MSIGNNNQLIYFDNNASTPIDKRVLEEMMPFLTVNYANSNSSHQFGLTANEAVKSARMKVAELIEADPKEIVFTSGSTEAINIAIKGVAEKYFEKGKHIITVKTEHPAVLDTCKNLENKGYEVSYLPVLANGLIDLNDLTKTFRNDTILVCIMYVNNETGVIQPINKIAELTHKFNSLLLTDATQAVGKIPIDVYNLDVDFLCMSGHKMYGPKGIGALFINQQLNIDLPALIHGGGQENGFRSGTLNVPGIIALGVSCEIAKDEMEKDAIRIFGLRNELESEMLNISGTFVNGNMENRIYNVSNICFQGFDANVMIARMKNVAVSNGSACSSAIVKPSHVLTAMGLSNDDAFASIRFSLGKFNVKSEVQTIVKIFRELFVQPLSKYA